MLPGRAALALIVPQPRAHLSRLPPPLLSPWAGAAAVFPGGAAPQRRPLTTMGTRVRKDQALAPALPSAASVSCQVMGLS
jgi:hypothetical protein